MNRIRADTPGKQEAEPAVLKRARVVVDSWEQASHSGQVNVPVTNGLIDKSNLKVELGEVVGV